MANDIHILIVEDDYSVAQVLQTMLQRSGYHTYHAVDGQTARTMIEKNAFDVAILDLNLGAEEMSGVDLLAILNAQSPRTAPILLTGYGTLESAILAVRLGAHDYLIKPSSMAQIRQSVESALHKQAEAQRQQTTLGQLEQQLAHTLTEVRHALGDKPIPAAAVTEPRFVERGALTLDIVRQVAMINNRPLDLTLVEYSVLACLINDAPRPITAQELVTQIYQYDSDPVESSNLIRSHISHLRQKLRQAGAEDIIRTSRGRGYAID